jgi:hypothetical protein
MKRFWIPLALFLLFQGCYETEVRLSDHHPKVSLDHLTGTYRSVDGRFTLESRMPSGKEVIHFRMEDPVAGRLFVGTLEAVNIDRHTVLSISGHPPEGTTVRSKGPFALAVLENVDTNSQKFDIRLLKTQLPATGNYEALASLLGRPDGELLEVPITFVSAK